MTTSRQDEASGVAFDVSVHVDGDGYPTEAMLELLRTTQDGLACLDLAAGYFNRHSCGKAWREGLLYKFATGGWSGCEDAADAMMSNLWVRMLWESSHRGGLFVFDVEPAYRLRSAPAEGAGK